MCAVAAEQVNPNAQVIGSRLLMSQVPEKSHHRSHYNWSPLLPIVFAIGLAVVGVLSVRQHSQLQRLRRAADSEAQRQGYQTYLLVGQLTSLHNAFKQQIVQMENPLQSDSPASDQARRQMETALGELADHISALNEQVNQSQQQMGQVIARSRWAELSVARLSPGVCLIQGEYIFVDPGSGRSLRYIERDPSAALAFAGASLSAYPVSTDGKGDVLAVQYTGTGFLIDSRGYLLTNQHVTSPWETADDYQHILAAGYEPRLRMFRAFFPGQAQPFDLRVVKRSGEIDVALLQVDLNGADIPVLPCEPEPDGLKAGQTVIVLGYPTGFDVLLARMSEQELTEIIGGEGDTFSIIAENLAARQLITPVATRGMCGRVSAGKIVYDAQTAIGGSGAPVLTENGKVVAINTALLKGFAGSNFGIPVKSGLDLLAAAVGKNPVQVAADPSGPKPH